MNYCEEDENVVQEEEQLNFLPREETSPDLKPRCGTFPLLRQQEAEEHFYMFRSMGTLYLGIN